MTNLEKPIGADLVVQFGWRNGAPDGIYVYDPADDETAIVQNYDYVVSGNTISATLNLSELGISPGQTVGISAFQEGASNGWQVDWMESSELVISQGGASGFDVDSQFNANGFGFSLNLTDEDTRIVDQSSIVAEMGDITISLSVSKANGITTIVGQFPNLLVPGHQ